MRFLANPKRRLAANGGFTLIVAMFVLLIISVLVAASIAVASQTSTSTTRDTNTKAALEAAEAGLQVAAFRLGKLEPVETACVTGTATAFPTLPATGEHSYCEGSAQEPLGNGATFQYWTSKKLTAGSCAGKAIPTEPAGVTQRCITSEGIAGAVKPGARLQTLVKSAGGESLFAVRGVLGLEEVVVSGSVKATSIVASNDKIIGEGSAAFEKGFELCPGGKFTPEAGTNRKGVTVGGIGGTKTDPALEITRSSGCPVEAKIPTEHATATSNNDERITSGLDGRTENTSNAVEFSGPPAYQLKLKSSGTLTLSGPRYYFCNLELTHSSELIIAKGAKVEIFIGSHTENPSCPAGSGKFMIEGSAHLENPNGAGALLIEMAGAGPVTIANGSSLKANIYAPEAEVKMSGSGALTGALVGKAVHLEAGSFNFTEEAGTQAAGTGEGSYARQAWEQCTPGSGATEGC